MSDERSASDLEPDRDATDPPGVGPLAGTRARAERRGDPTETDRRRGAGVPPASIPLDRRVRDRRGLPKRSAGLEISPAGLSLAVTIRDGKPTPDADDAGADGFARFAGGTACRFRPWPPGCGPTEPGFSEEVLAEAFAAAAAALGAAAGGSLNGVPIEIALGGALCVTRVLSGGNADADRGAADLAARAGRYLGLGRGEKTCVTAAEPLDARRKRVRVTVAPRAVAAAALAVCAEAGLRPGRIEHTLATLSAALHARGADGDRPVLLLAADGVRSGPGGGRVDVAVAHRGRLLLDYRPAGGDPTAAGAADPADGGDVLLRHLKRIRRYVAAELRGEPGGAEFDPPEFDVDDPDAAAVNLPGGPRPTRVYLTGTASATVRLAAELAGRRDLDLTAHPAPPGVDFAAVGSGPGGADAGPAKWDGGTSIPPGPLAAVLLACGAAAANASPGARGDLADAVRPAGGLPWRKLAAAGWPVALTLLLSAGLWGAAGHAGRGLEPLRDAVAAADADRTFADRIRRELAAADELDRRGAALAAAPAAPWVPALVRASSALAEGPGEPRRVWLESFRLDADGGVAITGGSHADRTALAFADRLRATRGFGRVQMIGSQEVRYRTGPGVRFQLTAELAGPARTAAGAAGARR